MSEFYWIAVVATTVISAARLTRLFVYDEFPPIARPRAWFKVRAESSDWGLIAECGFCASFWVTAAVFVWGLLSHVYGHPPNDLAGHIWWAANGVLAMSYVAASYVARDGDES